MAGNVTMFKDCRMTEEVLVEAAGQGYRIAVIGSPILCVEPSQAQNLWPHAAVLEVTNTSGQPIGIEHKDGSVAGFAFRADRVADARDPREGLEYETGPISAADARVTKTEIAPGAAHRIGGDPRYILRPIELAKKGERVDGTRAGDDERFDRNFRVEFVADFILTIAGTKVQVHEDLPAILRIMVRDEGRE
jgi:hypothetical protein